MNAMHSTDDEQDEFFDLIISNTEMVIYVFYGGKRAIRQPSAVTTQKIKKSDLPHDAVFCRIRPANEGSIGVEIDGYTVSAGDVIYQSAEVAEDYRVNKFPALATGENIAFSHDI